MKGLEDEAPLARLRVSRLVLTSEAGRVEGWRLASVLGTDDSGLGRSQHGHYWSEIHRLKQNRRISHVSSDNIERHVDELLVSGLDHDLHGLLDDGDTSDGRGRREHG